ncbi:hypothetical protein CBM2587_A50040 [Cupriavidus taiwanensis]|uniref:Uncharacterized protein n=1 Tax=Cupriavidus taiwanensis TaxID=164546 RepID=A0A375BVB2_9BURK|nr:hypothetical protein CBM2587_A50040 [Cupriavidus taiwanensis]
MRECKTGNAGDGGLRYCTSLSFETVSFPIQGFELHTSFADIDAAGNLSHLVSRAPSQRRRDEDNRRVDRLSHEARLWPSAASHLFGWGG